MELLRSKLVPLRKLDSEDSETIAGRRAISVLYALDDPRATEMLEAIRKRGNDHALSALVFEPK